MSTTVTAGAGVLVICASTHGYTAKIASRLADSIRAEGLRLKVRELARSVPPAAEAGR